jgi:hypothetical protein
MTTTPEVAREIIDEIGSALRESGCPDMRFALVVWCDCNNQPLFVGGNDHDVPRVLKMMKLAADTVMKVQLETRGSA